jgi:hypothetical protein
MKPLLLAVFFSLIVFPIQMGNTQPLENPEAAYLSPAYEELYLKEPRFHGEEVKTLQRFLLFMGFDIGPDGIDGWFGPDTEKAVLQFQKGLPDMRRGSIPRYIYARPLHWEPFWISYLGREVPKSPSMDSAIPSERIAIQNRLQQEDQLNLRSYFGSIIWTKEYVSYHSILEAVYSPDRRFLYFLTSLPEERQENGPIKIVIWDLLSGQSLDFPVLKAFFHPGSWDSSRQNVDYSGIFSPRILKAYWHPPLDPESEQPSVILEIVGINADGQKVETVVELQPYRYEF